MSFLSLPRPSRCYWQVKQTPSDIHHIIPEHGFYYVPEIFARSMTTS
jgi:hypothetical protein